MYFQHAASGTGLVFDDPNLISASGLEPVMRLAGRAGLGRLAREHLAAAGPPGASTPLKAECLVAGMLLGADSIEDLNRLRDGALTSVIGQVRAPSTLGSFLRAVGFGNVRQLPAVHPRLPAGLARQAPLLPGAQTLAFLDTGASQFRVYGPARQGAGFGTTKIQGKVVAIRGLNVLAAALSTPLAAPLAADTRLRGGTANCTRGAASFLREQIGTARMIVRRVKRLSPQQAQQPLPGMPDEVTYRYHAVFTDSPYAMLQADACHRGHAIIEPVFSGLAGGPLAHMPSGDFSASAAWATLTAITQNLLRAAGSLASFFYARARGATIREDLIKVPVRLARTGRGRLTLHAPQHWHAEAACLALHAARAPTAAAA